MRILFSKFALSAGVSLALVFTFSCSGGDNGNEQSYNYCITADNTCLVGPFTISACNGQVSNSCPNGGGNSSSKNNSSSSSRSSGGDILGSCAGAFAELGLSACAENVSQTKCSSKGGTFNSGGVCNETLYPYCFFGIVEGSVFPKCDLVGSASVPTKADCYTNLFVTSANCSTNDSWSPYANKGNEIANYRTVQIGDQVWMAENLDYDVSGSKCNQNNEANCVTYGRLYDWSTVMDLPSSCNSSTCVSQISEKHRGICPIGWHIPSDAEWKILINFVGGPSTAGTALKATSGWDSAYLGNGNGQDVYDFSALPGGFCLSGGSPCGLKEDGHWWSSSEYSKGPTEAYSQFISYGESVITGGHSDKIFFFSVRCVKD